MRFLRILIFVAFPFLTQAQPEICLQLTPDTIWGSEGHFIASGDMNNDGFTDIIDYNVYLQCARVLLGNGAGAFTSSLNLVQTFLARNIVTARFNQDLNLDLLVKIGGKDTLLLLLGTGTGSVTLGNKIKIASAPSAIESADFNKDNKMDFVVACPEASVVSVFLGTGTGSFSSPTSFSLTSEPKNAIIRDFNNDGNMDVFIETSSVHYFLRGGGNGTFTLIPGPPAFNSQSPYTFSDVNNDNRPDLISMGLDSIRVLLATTNFGFGNTGRSYIQGLSSSNAISFAVVDLNNDGKKDLAVATNFYSITVLYGNGAASFSAPQTYTSPVQWFRGVKNIHAVDLTGDNKQDLVVFQFDGVTPFGIYGIFINCNSVDVGVLEQQKELSHYNLFPNPANEHLFLLQNAQENGTKHFCIYDQFGRKIKNVELNFSSGPAEIKTEDLPVGIYILREQDIFSENKGLKFFVAR